MFAQNQPNTGRAENQAKRSKPASRIETRLEPWYLHVGFGTASINYPAEIKARHDYFGPGDDAYYDQKFTADIFGFYQPIDAHTMAGFNINWLVRIDAIEGMNEEFGIICPLFSISMYHFFNKIGDGFFIRGDAGVSVFSYRSDIVEDDSPRDFQLDRQKHNSRGFGVLAGIGYALPVSGGTRLLFHLNYAFRMNSYIENREWTFRTLSFAVGLLF